jgi:uncharacterized protein (DUF736 family)
MIKIGAMWSRTSKKGVPFITGIIDNGTLPHVEKTPIVVFKNTNKAGEKSPDYLMFLSEPAEGRGGGAAKQGDMFSSSGGDEGFGSDDDTPF